MDPVEALHSDVKEIRADIKEMWKETRQDHQAMVLVQDRQQKSLDEHMRRTEILENTVKPLAERESARAALTRVAAAICTLIVAAAAAVEIYFHVRKL